LNQRYEVASDTWLSDGTSIPGTQRSELSAVVDNSNTCSGGPCIYAVGGRGDDVLNNLQRYDPVADTWTDFKGMRVADDTEHNVALAHGKIFVAGGRDCGVPLCFGSAIDKLQIYDIAKNNWHFGTSLPAPRSDSVAIAMGNKIYLFGGFDGANIVDTTLIYDIGSKTWSTGASMPTPLADSAAGVCSSGHKIHLFGGVGGDESPTGLHYVYDPIANAWQISEPLPDGRTTAETQAISDAKQIFIVGGGIFGTGGENDSQLIWKC